MVFHVPQAISHIEIFHISVANKEAWNLMWWQKLDIDTLDYCHQMEASICRHPKFFPVCETIGVALPFFLIIVIKDGKNSGKNLNIPFF